MNLLKKREYLEKKELKMLEKLIKNLKINYINLKKIKIQKL